MTELEAKAAKIFADVIRRGEAPTTGGAWYVDEDTGERVPAVGTLSTMSNGSIAPVYLDQETLGSGRAALSVDPWWFGRDRWDEYRRTIERLNPHPLPYQYTGEAKR